MTFRLATGFALAACLLLSTPGSSLAAESPHAKKGIALPGSFMLNGRFDIAYERVGFKGNPADGSDAISNYHHFLFLTRDNGEDPFFLRAELVDLSFYEFGFTFDGGLENPWRGNFRAGKIMVPFGPEPLFHKNYGGREAFDNDVMPTFFSTLGMAGNFTTTIGPLRVNTDLYAIQGYRVKDETASLDLKTGFSRADDPEIAVGGRVGLGWGPISVWYSAMINELGFGRTLWLQALDVSIWRIPGIPVIEDMVLGFGGLRADVSGGGSGIDFYHFADYLYLRYYPNDWLYFQYRTGLRSSDNKRGTFIDDTRLDANDNSTHNFGVVARWDGMTAGLYYYLNFEKADEVDNDLLRLLVTYEF